MDLKSLQQDGLEFISTISSAVIFRKSAKNLNKKKKKGKKSFHLLIYALFWQGMRKLATFSECVNKKGKGTWGEV